MATDTPGSAPGGRPRPILLVLLGIAVVLFVVMKLGGSAVPAPPPSNPAGGGQRPTANRPAAGRGEAGAVEPSHLDVHLEALQQERPAATAAERNPFRFRPAAPPPAEPSAEQRAPRAEAAPPAPAGPPPAPPPPPITVKFIGVIDRADGTKMAVFTDCSAGRRQSQAVEGGTVDGRYRLVKIGMQSVIIEHLDGRGRTTLAQGGQECVK